MKSLREKILVIEDDLDVQELIEGFFRPRGYEVICYDNAVSALADMSQQKLQADVIITDLMLPGMSGIDFTKKLKSSSIDTPIILMTAHKKVEIAVEAIQAGAYDFVVKPLHFPQLLVSVERATHLLKVKQENQALKTAVQLQSGVTNVDGVIGKSPGIRQAMDLAKRVSKSTANVLITGESGVGKEVIAKAIHNLGTRRKMPMIAINCSAIPENLLESELFGHAKGSFTGASEKKIGLFEEAEGGTLFLDEIGDLSLPLQAKLLRVLQERKIKRIGENQFRNIDVRVISATHKDLTKEIAEGRFREDLYFRLNVIPIRIPALRDRKEDIVPLAEFFLKKYAAMNNSPAVNFSKAAIELLLNSNWRGNVRELENSVERAVVLSSGSSIEAEDIYVQDSPSEAAAKEESSPFDFSKLTQAKVLTIEELISKYAKHVLEINSGAKDKTAKDLGIDRKTLYRRLNGIHKTSATATTARSMNTDH